MTIYASIQDMENEVTSNSSLGTRQAWALEFVSDLVIRVMNTNAVDYEYAITDGDETFRCYNRNMFIRLLETVL